MVDVEGRRGCTAKTRVGHGGVYQKLELVMGGGEGGFEKNEGKVWGVHIIF